MELELEYLMLMIEKNFYEENQLLLEKSVVCNAQKRLPCNCLTGLAMNYWGYVIRNCLNVGLENVFDIKHNKVNCILSSYKGKGIIPVMFDENDKSEYWFSSKVCAKEEVSRDKIYIKEHLFSNYADMVEHISDSESKCGNRITECDPIYDFLSRFIIAVRNQKIEIEGKVLFAIMLFFFPNRTAKLVLEYISKSGGKGVNKEYIKEFMKKYGEFLDRLKSYNEYNFFSGFSAFFQDLTGIYVGEWIEECNRKYKNARFWRQTLVAAYNRNLEERKRRNSRFKKVEDACA